MQYDIDTIITQDITLESIGYQYDSRDKEILLESGYTYKVYNLAEDGEVIENIIDLVGETNAV